MEWLGPFAEAFGYTPGEFRALRFADFQLLVKHLGDRVERARAG